MKERKHPGGVNSERANEAFLKISMVLLEEEEKNLRPWKVLEKGIIREQKNVEMKNNC